MVMAHSVYDRLRMEILLFHGQFAWVHGALQSLTQHHGTRCKPLDTFKSKLKTYLFAIAYEDIPKANFCRGNGHCCHRPSSNSKIHSIPDHPTQDTAI